MKERQWIISEYPKYESDKLNDKLKFAYWEGHRDFAYDLLNFVKPERIVELGSQYGCSLFSFCQSVKDNHLSTIINAVDYWSGDVGAEIAGEEVYKLVKYTVERFYNSLKINLFQTDFDTALGFFEDESIDILHIDGGHQYEDVEHDMSTWLPKLKKDGIILFHDVFSHIDQGSCIHWVKTKEKYPNLYFEFRHSCGLGILFPKGNFWFNKMKEVGFEDKYQKVYYYRSLYRYTKNRFEELSDLYTERFEAIKKQSKMIDERDQAIESQRKLIDEKDEAIKSQTQLIDERDQTIEGQRKLIDEKDEAIKSQTQLIDERDQTIEGQRKLIDEKDEAIKSQTQLIDERDQTIEGQRKLIDEKDEAIKSQTQLIDERDQTIEGQRKLIDEKDEAIKSQTQLIDERDQTIEGQRKLIDEKDEAIKSQTQLIDERNWIIADLSNKLDTVYNHKILSKIIFH